MPHSSSKQRNTVRIIGGQWRGRRIEVIGGTDVRPTPDRVRETLFNWLAPRVREASCLDLYAGTGALGLEALSRGAARVVFVERNRRLAQALRAQLGALGADASVLNHRAEDFLERVGRDRFDIVFLDPPFEQALEPILKQLAPCLRDRAVVYVERAAGTDTLATLVEALPDARISKEARAGDVVFGLLAYEQP